MKKNNFTVISNNILKLFLGIVVLFVTSLLVLSCEKNPIVVYPETESTNNHNRNKIIGTWATINWIADTTDYYPYRFIMKITEDGHFYFIDRYYWDPDPEDFFIRKRECSLLDHSIVLFSGDSLMNFTKYYLTSDTTCVRYDLSGDPPPDIPIQASVYSQVLFTKIDDIP